MRPELEATDVVSLVEINREETGCTTLPFWLSVERSAVADDVLFEETASIVWAA